MLDATRVTDQLTKARAYADSIGKRDQLEQQLTYLDTYAEDGERGRSRCRLFPDFAPHSFEFVLEVKKPDGTYNTWFNGGLIFHGGGKGGMPELSVSLSNEVGWQVHT